MKASLLLIPSVIAGALLFVSAAVPAAERITIAVNDNERPYGFTDMDGNLTGFTVDIARALCRVMETDCRLVPVPFHEFIPGVASQRFDMAVGNILRTPERERVVDFSNRIWRSATVFIGSPAVMKDITPASLQGKRIAVQKGTVQERYVTETYRGVSDIYVYPTNPERNAAYAAGKADLMVGSMASMFLFLRSPDGASSEIIGQPLYAQGLGGDVAIPLPKGRDDLRRRVNDAISTIQRNGTFRAINDRYFPVDIR